MTRNKKKRDSLEMVLKQALAKVHNRHKFSEGYCVELALALKEAIGEGEVLVGHRFYSNEGEDYETPLSHAVYLNGDRTYDYEGSNAIERWEQIYENPYDCGGDTEVYFEWSKATKKELEELVRTHRHTIPCIDTELVSTLTNKIKNLLRTRKKGYNPPEPYN